MTLPLNLQPSAARTYSVPVPAAGSVASPILVAPKSSADVLDYTLDFSAFLSGTDDTLTGVNSLMDNQSGTYRVTAVWAKISGSSVTVLLASGVPYSVTMTGIEVVTAQGRVFVVPLQIQITGASPATLPPSPDGSEFPSDVTLNGSVLTAGTSSLPVGFASNGGAIVRLDPSIPIPAGYASNGGLIVRAS